MGGARGASGDRHAGDVAGGEGGAGPRSVAADPAPGARMHPDKRSIRRKFTRAQRDDNFLLDMIRRIRKRE